MSSYPPVFPTSTTVSGIAYATVAEVQTKCGFEGNNDIYGVGIRIGIYCQILAVWFANYFLLSEAQVLRDSVSIFSVAILIVSLIFAASPSDILAVEAFVLLQILAWSCMMGVRAKSSYHQGKFSEGSLLRRVVCEVVNLINICLHVWFWWTGIDRMKPTPCGTFLMMYVVKTGMFGWARKVMMAMSLFVLLCTTYWVSVESSRPWTLWKVQKARMEFSQAVTQWTKSRDENPDPKHETDREEYEVSISDDGCKSMLSQDSKSRHSPTNLDFGIVRSHSAPLAYTADNSKESSRVTICEIPSLHHPTLPAQLGTRSTRCEIETGLQILYDVDEAEKYIRYCISASPYQNNLDGKPLALPAIIRSILQPQRYRSAIADRPSPPSWFRCHLHTWAAFLTFRFPSQAFIVYSHLRQAGVLDPLSGPFQSYAAITYKSPHSSGDKTLALPSWSAVTLASDLMLNTRPAPKKVWLGWYYTILDLLIHVVVILQVELTLHWNSVTGLASLWTSVGQLVPFIIGVGGLGLVLSRWVLMFWAKRSKRLAKKSGWDKDGVILGANNETEAHKEAFGLPQDIRNGYEQWKAASAAGNAT
ncbi:hypothetical protein ACN47E_000661 [Coniothyrium glycines]